MDDRFEVLVKRTRMESLKWALATFVVYTTLAVIAGFFIFLFSYLLGNEKTVTREVSASPTPPVSSTAAEATSPAATSPSATSPAPTSPSATSPAPTSPAVEAAAASEEPPVTKEETKSLTLVALFTALAGGGWLLLPLKFAWDEVNKNSDAVRKEIENEADNSRSLSDKMRDYVWEGIRLHFGPLLYRQRSVEQWAGRCLRPPDQAPTKRLLYSIALFFETTDRLRRDGRPLVLRSVADEDNAGKASKELQDAIYELLRTAGEDAEAQLVESVRVESSSEPKLVPFTTFLERIEGEAATWRRLREIDDAFERVSDHQALENLRTKAAAAQNKLTDGLNKVFSSWYTELLPKK